MKSMLLGFALVVAALASAQQQGQPPGGTPPTFPEGQQVPSQPMPPDQEVPPSRPLSTSEVKQQITEHLKSEPALENTEVVVSVDQGSVELRGTVATDEQHDLAVRIARSFAGDREIVDHIRFRQQT